MASFGNKLVLGFLILRKVRSLLVDLKNDEQ